MGNLRHGDGGGAMVDIMDHHTGANGVGGSVACNAEGDAPRIAWPASDKEPGMRYEYGAGPYGVDGAGFCGGMGHGLGGVLCHVSQADAGPAFGDGNETDGYRECEGSTYRGTGKPAWHWWRKVTGQCFLDRAKAFEDRLTGAFLKTIYAPDDEIPDDMAQAVKKLDDAA